MLEHDDAVPLTCPLQVTVAPLDRPRCAEGSAPVCPSPVRSAQALSGRALRALAALQGDGIDATLIAERFPYVLNLLGDVWSAPTEVLERIRDLLVDPRGERRTYPDDVFALVLALQRHTVRRIVASARLQTPPPVDPNPGRCPPSSPS